MLATVVTALGQAALRVLEATHVVVTAPDGGLCAHHRLRIADALGRPLDRVAHAEGIGRLLRAAAAGTLPPPAFVPLLLEPTIAPQGLRLLEAFATIAAQEAGIATVDVMAAVATHPAIASDAASAIADVARGDVDAERSVARFERGLRGVACVDTRSALGAVREVIARTRRTHGADHDDASTPVVVVLDGAHREDPESTWVVAPEVVGVMLRARPAARVLEASAPLATLRREADEALADDLVAMADTVTRGAVARWAPIAGTEPPAARAIFREGVEAVSDAVEAVWAPEVSAVAADVAGRLAWERVRALAWSIGLDPMTTPYTVAALADPTDDASGGLLTHTESARVVAVTDGRHVLVDPDPAPAAVEERRRLASRNEGWDGFDPALLSEGFVFSSCGTTDALLSRGARRVLGLPDDGLTGQGLARAVLEAPVDIVWVGGPPAEPIRVDAVRARVVTGADGLSREVRVALALAGHAVDGDGSAAAVGRRVADAVVSMPEEDAAARREATLLAETSRRVRRAVVAARQSRDHLDELRDLLTTIDHVVPHGRARWGLPDDAALRARAMRGVGLVVPEVTMVRAAVAAWCEATAGVSGPAVAPLIDELGLLALPRLVRETGCSLARAIRTMQLAWAAVDGAVLAAEIDAAGLPLDDDVSARDVLSRAVTDVARWVLDEIAEGACTDATATALHRAMAIAPDDPSSWLVGAEAERWHHRVAALELGGVPSPVAVRLARASWAPALFDVVDVARASGLPLDDVGRAYGALVGTVDLVWIAERLETLGATGSPWTRTAAITTGAWLRRVRRDLVRDDRALEPAAALVRAARASGEAGLDVIVAVVHALMRATAAQGGTSWQ